MASLGSCGGGTRTARGDTAQEARLKAEPGGEIVAPGGARFARSLTRLGLVGEFRQYVMPVAVGGGTPLFTDVGLPHGLRLVSSRVFQMRRACARLQTYERPGTRGHRPHSGHRQGIASPVGRCANGHNTVSRSADTGVRPAIALSTVHFPAPFGHRILKFLATRPTALRNW